MAGGAGEAGRALMVLGAALLAIGLFLSLGGKLFGLGRLPGDIVVRRGNFTLYIPLTSCVLLSLVLTLVLRILRR